MCSVTSFYGLYTHPAAMVSNYCTPLDIRPMFCSHQVLEPIIRSWSFARTMHCFRSVAV